MANDPDASLVRCLLTDVGWDGRRGGFSGGWNRTEIEIRSPVSEDDG